MSFAFRVFRSLAFCLSLIVAAFFPVLAQVQSSPSSLTVSPSPIADQARTVVEKYFALYAAKDLDGLLSLWSEKSPDYASLKQDFERQFTNEDYRLSLPAISRVKAEGEKTSLRATVKLTATDLKSKQTREQRMVRTFALVREEGKWKVWRSAPAENDLAEALVKARTEAERAGLLAEEKELLTAELARALASQGDRLYKQGGFAQALPIFQLELSVAEQIGDRREIVRAVNYIGLVHLYQGDYAKALERFQSNLTLNEGLANKSGVATTLVNIGNVHWSQGDYAQALEHYQNALAVGESLGDKTRIALALANIGLVYHSLGDYAAALESYQRSMVLDEAVGNKQEIAINLNNIARVYRVQGNYARALEYYQKSLRLNETLGNKYGIGLVLHNVGNVYRFQGNYAQALERYQKSLATREAIGDKAGIAGSLNNLGLLYRLQGNYAQALEHLQKSLALSEAVKNRDGVAVALNSIGRVHYSQGDFAQAMANYQKSLALREAMGNRAGVADTLNNIAEVHQTQGDYSKARETADRAAALAAEIGHVDALWKARLTAGTAYRALKQPGQARPAFEEAVNIIETLRANVAGGGEEQQRFFESKIAPYHAMVDLLTREGRPAEALAFAERAKARMLLDVLQTGRVNVTKAMTSAEKEQERQLGSRLVSFNIQISRETARAQSDNDRARLTELKTQLQKARLEFEAFQTNLYAAHPELRTQRGEAPVIEAREIAALLPDSGGALLEYVVTDEVTYLFGVTRGTGNTLAEVKVFTLPVKRAELGKLIESFRQQLAGRDLGFSAAARQLYQLLLEPAAALLSGKKELLIVPDDQLWELPFQALLDGNGRYVIETSAVSYAPSMTVLREMKTRRDQRRAVAAPDLLALGNPALGRATIDRTKPLRIGKFDSLPEAEREVKALGQLYGPVRSKVYVGTEAREDRAKAEASRAGILHFATHGTLNNTSPMYSNLVLAQGETNEDGLLEAWELMQMDLKAELAVLSACDTARGRYGAGEGMIGLTWALFVAGVPTTVVSQWQVESSSTRDLMVSFHRTLSSSLGNGKAKVAKSEALRQAALKLLKKPETSHPFYWAGFVLVGDAR